jgi:putative membrane protein
MNLWCASDGSPWTWEPRLYPGVWAFVLVVALTGIVLARRVDTITRRQKAAWWGGVAALWVATDWPLGALGAGYLSSAHMVQYMLYTFLAAPLLVLALPEDLVRRLDRGVGRTVLRRMSHPAIAAVVVNIVLVATHAPFIVDSLRTSQLGSFGLDIAWILGGVVLWWPVCGPLPEMRPSYPVRTIYLFLAAGLVPMIPGGFLTFADAPLYRIFELAPRVTGMTALEDQQAAGALMKVGNLPIVWPVMTVMFWRWCTREDDGTVEPSRRAAVT